MIEFDSVLQYAEGKAVGITTSTSTHKLVGKDLRQALKEYSDIVFRKGTVSENEPIKNVCVTFPGRFQPYNKAHQNVYKMLIRIFGEDSMWILPSESTHFPSAPLSFNDRKQLILQSKHMSIDANHIRPRKSKGFNRNGLAKDLGISSAEMDSYIFVVVISNEDDSLMPTQDKETYYQPWPQELYSSNPEEIRKMTRYLPSMKKYGFKFVVDAFTSEMGDDFGKKISDKQQPMSFLRKQAIFNIGINELKKSIVANKLEDVQDQLPYDVNAITDKMKEKIIGNTQKGEETIDQKNIIKDSEVDVAELDLEKKANT